MLQMGQRRSLADSPNGTDVKMGGEGGEEEGTNHLAPQFHFSLLMGISSDHFVCLFPVHPFVESQNGLELKVFLYFVLLCLIH